MREDFQREVLSLLNEQPWDLAVSYVEDGAGPGHVMVTLASEYRPAIAQRIIRDAAGWLQSRGYDCIRSRMRISVYPGIRRLLELPELPVTVREVLDAGRVMATLLEEYIGACGNSPPPCVGCKSCQPARDALVRWGCACWTLHRDGLGPETELTAERRAAICGAAVAARDEARASVEALLVRLSETALALGRAEAARDAALGLELRRPADVGRSSGTPEGEILEGAGGKACK